MDLLDENDVQEESNPGTGTGRYILVDMLN